MTPVRRVAGRVITTVDGLDAEDRDRWAGAFVATGASQCGFCTPGIVCRLEGLRAKGTAADDHAAVDRALAAHLCRCTGWQTIGEAWAVAASGAAGTASALEVDRDLDAAGRRATIEGGVPQRVGPDVVLGRAGFADDTAPTGVARGRARRRRRLGGGRDPDRGPGRRRQGPGPPRHGRGPTAARAARRATGS